jgi:hypothetical protein
MRIFVALALCATAASGAVANPSQFDLKCSGTQKLYNNGPKGEVPFSRTFHIDLDRGEYCVDDCRLMLRVQSVDSLKITFSDEARRGGTFSSYGRKEHVNRQTGRYELMLADSGRYRIESATGTCEPAPFTPFPATKF